MAKTELNGGFEQTRWSLVLRAGDGDPAEAEAALGELFQRYRSPLLVYLRGQGHSHADAEDLLQGFFARLIEKGWLAKADPHRGRFRSFLLGSLKHFKTNEWRHGRAERRGGGKEILALDDPDAKQCYELEPGSELAPDVVFDRLWAQKVLEHALASLRQEYERASQAERFAALEPRLPPGRAENDYAVLAKRLSLTVNGIKAAVSRMRQRFGALIRAEVADTVGSRADVEAEMNHLLAVLRETS